MAAQTDDVFTENGHVMVSRTVRLEMTKCRLCAVSSS